MSKNVIANSAPSRRLFLAAGSAAVVFAGLGAAVAVESPDAALIAKGNAAYAAFFESLALPDTHDADAQSDDLYDLMRDNAEDLCSMQARALEGVKAKARALMIHLDMNRDCTDILPGADLHERLAWSLVADILAL